MATMTATHTDIQRIFDLQRKNQQRVSESTAAERIAKLKKLKQVVLDHTDEICKAMHDDFRKHESEVSLTEIYPITSEIKHAIKHIRKWMRPTKVGTPMSMFGTSSWIHHEPKGVCLIISPWNFPFNLTFLPLISAVASGNCVVVKPSENTPRSAAVMKKIVGEVFREDEVALFEGAVETATELLALPFNHIHFTGAPSIGKIVMTAAAKNLASVTLELGGKSPTIVDKDVDIKKAAKRIAWGKCMNNGQICIAPDYLFVHESRKDEFIAALDENISAMYGKDASQSESYCRIVNTRHFHRVKSYLDDAVSNGAQVIRGGNSDESSDYIEPTLLTNVDSSMDVMKNEIFGPVLPIMTYSDISEALDFINAREKPLALYIYSKSKKMADHIIKNTRAGGTVINHSLIHNSNSYLPFGGSNNSGIGKSNGEFGFKEFSNERAVLKQWSPFNAIDDLLPPYNKKKQKMIDMTIKYF